MFFKDIGIIGGGQLAQMLAHAAEPLGIRVHALVTEFNCPAQSVARLTRVEAITADHVADFSKKVDCFTFEFENIDCDWFAKVSIPIFPGLEALKTAQDRELEKNCFLKNNIPTTPFKIAESKAEYKQAVQALGYPLFVKTCRDGYDGKGQFYLKSSVDLDRAWEVFNGKRVILEKGVLFDRELSILAVRNHTHETRFYPLIENEHQGGILKISRFPYADKKLQALAEDYIQRLLNSLNYRGVLALELFQCGETLLANEMAPRVHNSGHVTIESAETSQFENHIRAVSGLPLGSTTPRGWNAMVNFIGQLPDLNKLLSIKNLHYHTYHKMVLPNRKLGHATICANSVEEREQLIKLIQNL